MADSKQSNELNSETSLPVVMHFGCGKLGVGAVLPFLINRYGRSHIIIAVQRRSKSWSKVPNNIIFPMRTKAGDCMPFRTVVVDNNPTTLERIKLSLKSERRLLLLVPDIQYCYDLMTAISKLSQNNLIISCSLGEGQPDLVQLLSIFLNWEKALIFENNASDEWENIPSIKGKAYHHILVDRICWHLEFLGFGKAVLCHCEAGDKVPVSWPKDAGIPLDDVRPVDGVKIVSDWKIKIIENDDEKNWHHHRKRALINAPHAIAALLCYRLLASRKMEPDKQYLAPLQEMLRTKHPEWEMAMDHYLRLRAVEVAFDRQRTLGQNVNIEQLHADYLDAYQIATKARERFFATNDRLDRLMSQRNLAKELEKFDEHILKPIKFYEQTCKDLMDKWIYGRPNHVDIDCLRDFLTETFLEATRWLTKQSGQKEQL